MVFRKTIRFVLLMALVIGHSALSLAKTPAKTVSSWYGRAHQGKRMANGKPFDMRRLTAAHRTIAFGTCLLISYPLTSRQVVVEVTDRGPFVKGRSIDLSMAAADVIGLRQHGTGVVKIENLGKGDCEVWQNPGLLRYRQSEAK